MCPRTAAAVKHIDRTAFCSQAGPIPLGSGRSDDDGVAFDVHRFAEQIEGGGIAGNEFFLLAPGNPVAHEHVSRTGVGTGVIMGARAKNHRVAADGYRRSGVVAAVGMTADQFLLLGPGATAAEKHICGTGLAALRVIIALCSGNQIVSVDRHRDAKILVRNTRVVSAIARH